MTHFCPVVKGQNDGLGVRFNCNVIFSSLIHSFESVLDVLSCDFEAPWKVAQKQIPGEALGCCDVFNATRLHAHPNDVEGFCWSRDLASSPEPASGTSCVPTSSMRALGVVPTPAPTSLLASMTPSVLTLVALSALAIAQFWFPAVLAVLPGFLTPLGPPRWRDGGHPG